MATFVATCVTDATVRLWQTDTARSLAVLAAHRDAVLGVALSANGHLVASGGSDGIVKVWDARSGACLLTLDAHATTIWGVSLSRDGQLLAAGAADGVVRLWDTTTGRLLAALHGHTGMVRDVALSATAAGSPAAAPRTGPCGFGRPAPAVPFLCSRRMLVRSGAWQYPLTAN